MITNKDVRVENGNIVINGDKYPLDGQSPEAIMQIVEDNSDTTPTENSTAPITSGGVYSSISGVLDKIDNKNFKVVSQNFSNVDISTAWGGWYVTAVLSLSYSDLGLTAPPSAVFLSVKTESTTFMLMQIGYNAEKADFYLVRPNSNTGVNTTICALIVY